MVREEMCCWRYGIADRMSAASCAAVGARGTSRLCDRQRERKNDTITVFDGVGRKEAIMRRLLAILVVLTLSRPVAARVEAEAVVGQPFGVGKVTISGLENGIDASRVQIAERNGRALYPAVAQGVFGKVLGQILGGPTDRPAPGVTVHFLFTGEQPLELTVYTPQAVPVVVQPRVQNPRQFERERMLWWRQYNAFWREQRTEDNQPPLVGTYLTAMLAQRLGLEPPLLERRQPQPAVTTTTQSLELLLGMERLRLETLRDTIQGRSSSGEAANLALPAAAAWQGVQYPAEGPAAAIEPIALHVSRDWFYARFGRFSNYLWLNHLLEEFGGDISSMVTLRSYLAPMNKRVQGQLGLEQNLLGELLGDQVISDVALVGRDTFSREGAAMGILFEAKNTRILKNDLSQQRERALDRASTAGGRAETLTIAGKEVSFFSTPDNRLRSFYAVDGDYHLVTTSRAMVEQFLALDGGRGSLGQSTEFRFARQSLPLTRNDTVFVYFSTAFFEGLFSPHYQVELQRRMKAITDIELLMLARLAAGAERLEARSPAELAAAGLLPRGFGERADGSETKTLDHEIVDARRGARGTFTPIPDVAIAGITRSELAHLQTLNGQLASQWRRMDALLIGIQRTALDDAGRERLVIDGNLSPLDEGKYGWLFSILGPPTRQMVTPAAGDVVSVQAAVRGGLLSPRIPPHQLFLGVQDVPPLGNTPTSGLLQTLNMLRSTPGYLGSWPTAGFLDLLPLNLGGSVPDANGFSRLPLGLWRRQGSGLSVLSFDPQILADVTPQLRIVESEVDAQLRIHVEDLSQSKIRPWILSLYYSRGLAASAGNSRFLTVLSQQFQVPIADARATAETLLDAQLVCPLGGEYQLVEDLDGGARSWRSTAWKSPSTASVPDDFEAPLLKWFRGLDAHLTKTGGAVTTRIELDMQRKPTAPKLEIPLFNFNQLFGGGQKALKPKDKPAGEELPPPLPPVRDVPKVEPPRVNVPGARET